MQEPTVELHWNIQMFTIQGDDLRYFEGPIVLEKGTYRNKEKVYAAQRKLYSMIEEDQVIWCSQSEQCLSSEIGRFVHLLEVDERDLVVVVDALVWNHIIGCDPRYIPPEEYCDVEARAVASEDEYDVALRKAEDEYLAANLPTDLWAAVTKSAISKKSDQPLLLFPFKHSKVIGVKIVTEELAKARRGTLASILSFGKVSCETKNETDE